MNDFLHSLVVLWWQSIAPLSLQGGLLILAVAAIDRLLPAKTWPELRAALWILALVKLALPPTLASPMSLVPESLSVTLADSTVTFQKAESVTRWAGLAVQLWFAGLLLLAVGGGWRYHRLTGYWQRSSTHVAPPWFPPLLASASKRLGLHTVPEVRFSSLVTVPFVVGVLRPRVYLPEDLAQSQAEHVLLHELAHVRRRDPWLAAAGTALQLIYWFHPMVWWARGRLGALIEQCCDRTVTRALGGRPEGYRRTLLLFATRGPRQGAVGLSFLSPRGLLVARLRQLEHAGADRPRLRHLVTTAVVVAMLACCLPMARGADGAVASVVELIERPPGCLQLRYLVLERLAEQQAARQALDAQP